MPTNHETVSVQSRCGRILRQFLLVELMIGLEATVTLEVVLMIANIQTLGVPIRYASLPGMVSAAVGVFLIPTAGWIMGRWGKSKSAKAKILSFTTTLQMIGNLLVFLANSIKLLYFDEPTDDGMLTLPTVSSYTDQTSVFNPDTVINSTYLTKVYNLNDSSSEISTLQADLATPEPSQFVTFHLATKASTVDPRLGEENIRFYAIMAMVGYALLDCGYDSSNCFLKTFALSATEPKDHASIIVKSILVSSFGGCLIAVIGALGLGDYLTAGTGHDSNAAQCALVAGLCFVLDLTGLFTTLTTGFCCPPDGGPDVKEDDDAVVTTSLTTDEKSLLIDNHHTSRDLTSSEVTLRLAQSSHRHMDMEWPATTPNATDVSSASPVPHKPEVADQAELTSKKGIRGFIVRQKKQILINITTFFLLGSLYSFEVFAVNFVGEGIYGGDPAADVDTKEYQKYLDGIQTGSLGTLTYYISFAVVNAFQEFLLEKIGWKLEILVAAGIQVVVNLLCALTATLWSFYLAAIWTGIFRTAAVSVPYILANKFATEQGDGKDSAAAIAMVAAMLPLGFTICTALMGPLIDVTGNSATPIYYTAVTAFLGTVTVCFLKDK